MNPIIPTYCVPCVSPEPCCAYTLQRASWLLPIVDHGVDTEEDEDQFKVGPHHTQWRSSRHTI